MLTQGKSAALAGLRIWRTLSIADIKVSSWSTGMLLGEWTQMRTGSSLGETPT